MTQAWLDEWRKTAGCGCQWKAAFAEANLQVASDTVSPVTCRRWTCAAVCVAKECAPSSIERSHQWANSRHHSVALTLKRDRQIGR